MKTQKEPKAEIIAFYQGGAKVHASTTHEKTELEDMIGRALDDSKKAVKLDTVNEDENVADDCLILLLDKMLFCTILNKNDTPIKIVKNT